jgi:hypothetical protein
VVVGEQRPVAPDEVEQVRHLLQVGWHTRQVPLQVDVVKLQVDDVLDRTRAADVAVIAAERREAAQTGRAGAR